MRKDANIFAVQNSNCKLRNSMLQLDSEVAKLKDSERTLEEIAQSQQYSTQSLVQLVQENKVTLEDMKRIVRESIIAELMDAVLKGERDQPGDFSDMKIDPKKLRPFLGWRPLEVLKRTLECTTQLARMTIRTPLRRHYKPALSRGNDRKYKDNGNRETID